MLKGFDYVIGGSTSLALQGIKVHPKDIDIFADKENAFKINNLLKEFEVKPMKFSSSEFVKSDIGEFKINNTKVEVVGDFKIKIKDKWISRALLSKIIIIEGIKIPVTPLKEHIKSYEKLGRKKDIIKIKKIREVLK